MRRYYPIAEGEVPLVIVANAEANTARHMAQLVDCPNLHVVYADGPRAGFWSAGGGVCDFDWHKVNF